MCINVVQCVRESFLWRAWCQHSGWAAHERVAKLEREAALVFLVISSWIFGTDALGTRVGKKSPHTRCTLSWLVDFSIVLVARSEVGHAGKTRAHDCGAQLARS